MSYVKSSKPEFIEIEDEIIEEPEELAPEEPTSIFITLRLLKEMKLNIIGKSTGNMYVFNGAGSMVDVDEQDVEYLLDKVRNESCCGSKDSPYFEIVR